jgi:hypothetical protein
MNKHIWQHHDLAGMRETSFYPAGGCANWYNTLEINLGYMVKLTMGMNLDPAILFLGICPREAVAVVPVLGRFMLL